LGIVIVSPAQMNICNLTIRISNQSLRSATASHTSKRITRNRPSAGSELCMIRLVCRNRIWISSRHRCLCDSNNVLLCHARLGSRASAANCEQKGKAGKKKWKSRDLHTMSNAKSRHGRDTRELQHKTARRFSMNPERRPAGSVILGLRLSTAHDAPALLSLVPSELKSVAIC
jgi:hypothetical protein